MLTTPGVQPLPAGIFVHPVRGALAELPLYAKEVKRWLLRGHPATTPLLHIVVRRTLLRLVGVQVAPRTWGLERCWFESEHVSIGTNSFVNSGIRVEGNGSVTIGRDCLISPEVMILTSTHEISPDLEVARLATYRDVHIGDGCWLGARAVIMPGVTIGDGTVIGTGAVVTKDCEPGAMYLGVLARRVR